jgi:hypothetical protein
MTARKNIPSLIITERPLPVKGFDKESLESSFVG